MKQSQLILNALKTPEKLSLLSLKEWDTLICQARQAKLLPTLYFLIQEHSIQDAIPDQVFEHLSWTKCIVDEQTRAVLWEVHLISKTLSKEKIPLVLMKGAAYVLADLNAAKGRCFSDIDFIVSKDKLNIVESCMMLDGWALTHLDDYDQRYYRTWMHELPPMQHIKRQTVIDIHHAILPETAKYFTDSTKILNDVHPVEAQKNVFVLAPVDMLLHSIVHLFHEAELDHGLRDLFDIHRLLLEFSEDPNFWEKLQKRACELGFSRLLFYALRYADYFLNTPIPEKTKISIKKWAPDWLILSLMDFLFHRALLPNHKSCNDFYTKSARFLLYIRAHWLRMPPILLCRHLFQKAFISPKTEK